MKKILSKIFNRLTIIGLLILLQLGILIQVIWKLSNYFVYFYALCVIISFIVVLYLINRQDNPSYKLAWAIPILLFPVFGGIFYIWAGRTRLTRKVKKSMVPIYEQALLFLHQDKEIVKELEQQDKRIANQSSYIYNFSTYPIYKQTTTKYLSPGEVFFESLKEDLRKAKHFIFMQYFIIEEGEMWESLLDIMLEKVKEGVEVRLIYDDLGCVNTLPYRYNERLEKLGIKTRVFNPFVPALSAMMNNRDHRKITIVDGYIGFTGGVNLADEYINRKERFGHWKDAAIRIEGEAVWNLTMMFLQTWDVGEDKMSQYDLYKPHIYHPEAFDADGYVQPYADSPLDGETIGENVYINMIHQAKDYIYINTPYLVVDNEMITALTLAAKSGVDVRIVTPHKEDKWYVHIVTRAYYSQLIENGVKIYEYTPGFIHSKTFVADDELGIVGTINMDYRSLYLHFECAAWLYKTQSVLQIKEDFLETLKVCTPITLEDTKKVSWGKRLLRSILRLFAPLM
ncbi:cardiolipin synthase [Sporanaerobium hydrogeniformans]|uniref:Cardiolipin synthase n=1 Tax=Sporanaerobium hydrogeniformans TaxID=3072179 RepID=A0AC61DB41_9FIRM|nr:cardiolipin synthase [Sporanaerobium hydrogeniformans]PHV70263.1 cardiolipin synthase [Sporanaerobium hydrogeniformans]